jgi:hypothetical protein
MGASQSQPTTSKASCSRRYSSHAEIEMLFKAEIKSIIQKELSINIENPIDVIHTICAKLSAPEFKDAIMKKCSFSTTNVFVQEKPIEQINESKIEDKLDHSNQAGEPEQVEQHESIEPVIQVEPNFPVVQPNQAESLIQLEQMEEPKSLEQIEPLIQLEQAEEPKSLEQVESLIQLEQAEEPKSLEQALQLEQPETIEQALQLEQPETLTSTQQLDQLQQPETIQTIEQLQQTKPLEPLIQLEQHQILTSSE